MVLNDTPRPLTNLNHLSLIFGHLPLHTLGIVTGVSRLWAEAARREYLKRKGVEMCMFNPDEPSISHICNLLFTKEHVNLFWYNQRDDDGKHNPVYFIEKSYAENKQTLIKIPIHKTVKDRMEVDTFQMEALRGLLALNIPENKIILYTERKGRAVYNQFFDHPEEKAAYMLFGDFTDNFLEEIKLRCKKKGSNSTLWGGYFFHPMTVDRMETKAVAIKILGVESWSVALSYMQKKDKTDKKLQQLREKIKVNKRSIGLICGKIWYKKASKKRYTTVPEIMHSIKKVFPEIPIVGGFSRNASTHYYGVDSITKDPVRKIKDTNTLSLIIFTID